MTSIKDLANEVSTELLKDTTPPPADTFNKDKFPNGVRAGDTKFGNTICPTCGKPPTHPTQQEWPWNSQPPVEGVFMFRDELSAREYRISGMCQACQDDIFS